MKKLQVVLVDDEIIIREGFKRIFAGECKYQYSSAE